MFFLKILAKIMRAPTVVWCLVEDRLIAPLVVRMMVTAGGQGVFCSGLPVLSRCSGAEIRIGRGVKLCSRPRSNILYLARPCRLAANKPGALLEIGARVAMSGTTIVACERIRIGERTMIGAEVIIVDSDFHSLDPEVRANSSTAGAKTRPIDIGCDVFIGTRAIILKGVRIGDGAVIGAGAVVTQDVASREIVAGNPARRVGAVT